MNALLNFLTNFRYRFRLTLSFSVSGLFIWYSTVKMKHLKRHGMHRVIIERWHGVVAHCRFNMSGLSYVFVVSHDHQRQHATSRVKLYGMLSVPNIYMVTFLLNEF